MSTVLEKVCQVSEKSGPFDCIVILGPALNDVKDEIPVKMPVPTFFTNGSKLVSDEAGSISIDENSTLLNGIGIYQLSNGLKIGYLTGDENYLRQNEDEILTLFSKQENDGVDLLLTYQWSEAIAHGSTSSAGICLVDKVVKLLMPRYHFACSEKNKFTELNPFQWNETSSITRFLNIAEYGSGAKWAYAFSLSLGLNNDGLKIDNLSPNPYLQSNGKKHRLEEESTRLPSNIKKFRQILPEKCRFCFSNPDVEDHLIISISEHAYITAAKGPLTMPHGQMDFSGHCLIIPIEHRTKLVADTNDITKTPTYTDMESYESKLVKMNFEKFQMSTIIFSINSENSVHFHKQVMPIPNYLIGKFVPALDRQVHFNNERNPTNAKLNFKEFQGKKDLNYLEFINDPQNNYLQFTIFENSSQPPKVYVASFDISKRIDLQFGRRVVAFMLHLPKRVKWDSPVCKQSKEEEQNEVTLFQKSFKDYEFEKLV